MIGAIAGDIIGSVFEHRNVKTTEFELFNPGSRFTDDTVLTAFLESKDYEDGYVPSFNATLNKRRRTPMKNEGYYRKLFLIAALWNWAAGVPFLFFYGPILRMLGESIPEPPLYLLITAVLLVVFGWGFFLVYRNLENRDIVKMGAMASYFERWWEHGYVEVLRYYAPLSPAM